MPDFSTDNRSVLTLDAGGTNFDFSAICANHEVFEPIRLPSNGDNLHKCIQTIKSGFSQLLSQLNEPPVAISFAFPGPADYRQGIIGDLNNLPSFRGGVPLRSILEKEFQLPVYINNDADLFTYGEALCGILPKVNAMLKEAGNPKRYKNLVGLTLGTGFGGGVVSDGMLLSGDNSIAGEVWLSSSRTSTTMNAEEAVSTRAIKREYAHLAGVSINNAPEPKEIARIARGLSSGNRDAAIESFYKMGTFLGDVIANLMTLVDGLVVIGGGIAYEHELIFPAIEEQLNNCFEVNENRIPRMIQTVHNLEDESQKQEFLQSSYKTIQWPGIEDSKFNPNPSLAFGVTTLGTRKATAIGAYAYGLVQMSNGILSF